MEQHVREHCCWARWAAAAAPSHPQVSPLMLPIAALWVEVLGAGHVAPIEPVGRGRTACALLVGALNPCPSYRADGQ